MSNMILSLLLSWYSFFSINSFGQNSTDQYFYYGNPAVAAELNALCAVSGGFWDRDSRIAELNYFRKNFHIDFVFYNLGNFRYSSEIPVDEANSLTYSAFAYKFSIGYAIAFDRNLFWGIEPQYHRFEYYNQFAEGFTFNTGILHRLTKVPMYYEVFLRNFGLSSSEGYNFPGTLNLGIGYFTRSNLSFYYQYIRKITDEGFSLLGRGVHQEFSARYVFKDIVRPSFTLYLGDDLRLTTVSVKVSTFKKFFIVYDFTYRKGGFEPVHMLTLGVE